MRDKLFHRKKGEKLFCKYKYQKNAFFPLADQSFLHILSDASGCVKWFGWSWRKAKYKHIKYLHAHRCACFANYIFISYLHIYTHIYYYHYIITVDYKYGANNFFCLHILLVCWETLCVLMSLKNYQKQSHQTKNVSKKAIHLQIPSTKFWRCRQ